MQIKSAVMQTSQLRQLVVVAAAGKLLWHVAQRSHVNSLSAVVAC